jgi:hypothetical protein
VQTDRFDGFIAGVGTASGLRAVLGPRSPLCAFTDVMVEHPDGHRLLLAPTREVADYVGRVYRFDEVRIIPVSATVTGTGWDVTAGPLRATLALGRRPALGLLLRAVPRPLATRPAWITAVDVVARSVLPGVRTRGSAGGGRTEYYAALDLRRIEAATVRWEGADAGPLADVHPPVRFGFGSAPATPSVARVVTLVRAAHR